MVGRGSELVIVSTTLVIDLLISADIGLYFMIVALVSVALLIVKAALLSVMMFVSVRVNDRSWIHALFLGKSERTRPKHDFLGKC